jgi:phosphoglycolate phosphatase-like HAD superfamily hydrolase
MKEIIVMFDVDGTIISNTNGIGKEKLNLEVVQLMTLLSRTKNVRVCVWSGGGEDYARQIIEKYGLGDIVNRIKGKHEYDETIDGKVDIAFDDQHEFSLAEKNIIVRTK